MFDFCWPVYLKKMYGYVVMVIAPSLKLIESIAKVSELWSKWSFERFDFCIEVIEEISFCVARRLILHYRVLILSYKVRSRKTYEFDRYVMLQKLCCLLYQNPVTIMW